MPRSAGAGDLGGRAPRQLPHGDSPLYGRDVELALLSGLLDRATAGMGGARIVRGDPGIGKSRLLEAVVEQAQARSMNVHRTRGVQSEAHLPFAGLHQMLGALMPRLDELGVFQKRHLLAAFGLEEAASADRFRIALAALDLFTDAASDRPLLLVADDAQLLDAPTVDVLTFVARRLAADPIVVLFAVRGEAIADAGLDELPLTPLDAAASARLLRTHAPDLPPATEQRILREAAGNPLALVELPAATRSTDHDSGPAPDLVPLTARLERAFASRVEELPEENRMLLLAAAIDPTCELRVLLEATGSVVGQRLSVATVDAAAEAGLVELDATAHVRFRHPLMASAIYGAASFAERLRVHEALADALDHQPDKQIWHRASAAVGIDEPLSVELEHSADRALLRGAPAMGVSTLRRAAELTADRARRSSLLLRAAELAGELGQRVVAAELASLADTAETGPVEQARLAAVGEIVGLGDLSDAGRLRSLIEAAAERRTPVRATWPSIFFSGRRPGASGEVPKTSLVLRSAPQSIAPGSLRTIRVDWQSSRTRSPSRTEPMCCENFPTGPRIAWTRRRCASWAAPLWCSATSPRRARTWRTLPPRTAPRGGLGSSRGA